ncbi:hypothetical protein [Pelagicoccus sp. SDUM812003]|uniref:hypothetical protein n=1 Tax=Pelagicoccus sp. SDUM812003 TaxID=3041267 RepID=UPI00280FD843|nr:hypothetical protein [Pelagicoccus sp. SDUM812003]MDQ8203593.1 hypothetical protein [Pelagicoccus sp. SDUM812003]
MKNIIKRLFTSPKPAQPQSVSQPDKRRKRGWIGVDLDGTLAEYHGWRGMEHIGPPVPRMKERVMEWIDKGFRVKIFTARACSEEGVGHVKRWLAKHGFPDLDVTNVKDFDMAEYWDDRAVQVIENTGKAILSASLSGKPQAPLLDSEADGDNNVIGKRAT